MQLFYDETFALIIALIANFYFLKSQSQGITGNLKVESDWYIEGNRIAVTCLNNHWTKNTNVHHDLESVPEVTFLRCNFPATVTVQNILHSIGINNSEQVIFTSFGSISHRKSLRGLSTYRLNFIEIDFTEVPFDLLYDVENLGILEISSAHLARIPEEFFNDWAKDIVEVNLHSNALKKITTNDFVRLSKVNSIHLSHNRIEVIESGAFDSLIHLRILKLDYNKLQTLPNRIFHRTIGLTQIDLSFNSINELPHDLLVKTRKLESFVISHNEGNLTTLAPGFLKNLIHLKIINLSYNQIQNLPTDLFAGCSALEYVHLHENQLKHLPSGLFDDNEKMVLLYLQRNHLESLPDGIFKNLYRLETLLINDNRLISLTSENLAGLYAISTFDASYNNLRQIDDQFMEYLKSASKIDLSHNQLTLGSQSKIEVSENQNRSLLRNNLNKNSISTSENQNILQCDSYRNITKLHGELVGVIKYYKFIDLSYNRISKIKLSELFSRFDLCNKSNTYKNRSKRVSIYVDHNPLHCDCSIIDFVNYVNKKGYDGLFYVSAKTEDSRVGFRCASPREFENREVRDLRLEEINCLLKSTAPEDACGKTCICREYPAVQVFSANCSHKNLTRLPPIIMNVHNWSVILDMSGNMLQQTPSLRGSYLTYVTTLDLSNNNITRVTLDLFSPKLQHLKLHGNNISRLDSAVINHLAHENILRSITLHDNKWICDCEARELIYFVQNKLTSYNFSKMRCYGTNRILHKMTTSELCKNTIMIIVTASLSLAFFGVVIASLVVLYYKYQREIKVWLYSKQLCLWFVTDDDLDKDKEYDAFISFSHKDEDFVEKEIIAKLEGGPKPYKLCLHSRDWLAGQWIPLQINRSVAESRRTIVVLTPNFLESVWALIEFRVAHTQALKEGRARLIVIICGEIENIGNLDQEMQDYLRLNTYIKWGDPWFWDKLRYALPHSKEFSECRALS